MRYYYIADKVTNQEWTNITDIDNVKLIVWQIIKSRDLEINYKGGLLHSNNLPLKVIIDLDFFEIENLCIPFNYEIKSQDFPFGESIRSQIKYCLDRIDRDGVEDCTNQILSILVAHKLTN